MFNILDYICGICRIPQLSTALLFSPIERETFFVKDADACICTAVLFSLDAERLKVISAATCFPHPFINTVPSPHPSLPDSRFHVRHSWKARHFACSNMSKLAEESCLGRHCVRQRKLWPCKQR